MQVCDLPRIADGGGVMSVGGTRMWSMPAAPQLDL